MASLNPFNKLRFAEVDKASLFIQLFQAVGKFLLPSVHGQVDRWGGRGRIEFPDVVTIIDQEILIIRGPAGGSMRIRMIRNVVLLVPSWEAFRSG